jgi:hypothetical protein
MANDENIIKEIFADVDELFYKVHQPSLLINKYNALKECWMKRTKGVRDNE